MCAVEVAVDFRELPVGDAQQADRGRAFEYESLFGHVYPFVSIDIF